VDFSFTNFLLNYNALKIKQMNWKYRISSDPAIMFGKPVIKGTRVPVEMIVDKLAGGRTVEQLLKSYPHLEAEDIYACLSYAAESVKNVLVYEIA
jgi:uncharacterized protein (DUF433 family)